MVFLFMAAVAGRAVVEIYDAQKYYRLGCQLPKRYRQVSYYVVVTLAALGAGCVALILPTINPNYAKPAFAFVIGIGGEKVIMKLANLAPVLLRHFLDDK